MKKFKLFHNPSSEHIDAQNTNDTVDSETTSNQESSTDNDLTQSEQTQEKTFTQKQVDKIVSKRLKEVEAKYSDYTALKEELETFKQKVKQASEKAESAEQTAKAIKKTTSIELASKDLNFPVELANKLLEPSDFIVSEDGTITNIKELILKVISLYPQLVRKPSPDTPTANTLNDTSPSTKFSTQRGSKFFDGGGFIKGSF